MNGKEPEFRSRLREASEVAGQDSSVKTTRMVSALETDRLNRVIRGGYAGRCAKRFGQGVVCDRLRRYIQDAKGKEHHDSMSTLRGSKGWSARGSTGRGVFRHYGEYCRL